MMTKMPEGFDSASADELKRLRIHVAEMVEALEKIRNAATELRCTDSARHEALHQCGIIAENTLNSWRGIV